VSLSPPAKVSIRARSDRRPRRAGCSRTCRSKCPRHAQDAASFGRAVLDRSDVALRQVAPHGSLGRVVTWGGDEPVLSRCGLLTTIAADPKHLGARIGFTVVLHTWGSALTHHPHAHVILPGGGLSPDGSRWIACRPGFFLPARVLSRLFLDGLAALRDAGCLAFFGHLTPLADKDAFDAALVSRRSSDNCRANSRSSLV
jgi:Putative transposase